MNLVIILLIVVALLFVMTYFTKRRFGVLGLALCAGALLSSMWAPQATTLVSETGIQLVAPPLASVVGAALVLLPAVFLLFSGPSYHKQWQRVIGSAAFALLATSFLLAAFGDDLRLDQTGQQVYDLITNNRTTIVTVAIIYALFDIVMYKTPKLKD